MNRLVVTDELWRHVQGRFAADPSTEDGLFLLARVGKTATGLRLVAYEALDPPSDAWDVKGPDSLTPSAQWFSAALGLACAQEACLVLVHSHPHPLHPAALSALDISTMRTLAPVVEQITRAPFALVAVKHDQWEGAVSVDGLPVPLNRIDSVGQGLSPLSALAATEEILLDDRQIRALGTTNARLRSLTVALIGCGGTGAAVAEQLYRMGVATLMLFDDDIVDTKSNVRRMLGSTLADANEIPHPQKVDVVARRLRSIGLPHTEVIAIPSDIRTEAAFRCALDADVVVCTTDTHSSRAVLNDMSCAYAMPLIDVGARISTRKGELEGMLAERRIVTPNRPCLWCTATISRSQIAAEHMEPERRAELADEGYVAGGGLGHEASVIALNVLASALGACAVPGLVNDLAARIPHRTVCDGILGDSWPLEAEINGTCSCRRMRLMADAAPIPLAAHPPTDSGEEKYE